MSNILSSSRIALLLLCILSPTLSASTQTNTPSNQTNSDENTDDITTTTVEDHQGANAMDALLNNPTVISGVESGTQALNRSVDNLMESLFYSLMNWNTTEHWIPGIPIIGGLERKVLPGKAGDHLVVDRIYVGPTWQNALTPQAILPLGINVYLTGELLNVYLRTDQQRILENDDQHWFRRLLNNWFGLLNILENILPPSFNPNFLYDPFGRLADPFTFPLNLESFNSMNEGSIKSYALNGGITFPIDVAKLLNDPMAVEIKKFFEVDLPIGWFIEGEYRINVFKRSPTIAWVGLSKSNSTGLGFDGFIGTTYFLFANSLKPIPWKGVPVILTPFNISLRKGYEKSFQLLYEFDLASPKAQEAYQHAVKGDFIMAKEFAMPANKIEYHFAKNVEGPKVESSQNVNAIAYKNKLTQTDRVNHIHINDPKGDEFFLNTSTESHHEKWDIIFGPTEEHWKSLIEIPVDIMKLPEDPKQEMLVFRQDLGVSYLVRITLDISDKFCSILKYREHLQLIRELTGLKLNDWPLLVEVEKQVIPSPTTTPFTPMDNELLTQRTHPPAAGRFSASLQLHFDYRDFAEEFYKLDLSDAEKIWQFIHDSDYPRTYSHIIQETFTPLILVPASYLYPIPKKGLRTGDVTQMRDYLTTNNPFEIAEPEVLQTSLAKILSSLRSESFARLAIKLLKARDLAHKLNITVKPSSTLPQEASYKLEQLSTLKYQTKNYSDQATSTRIADEKLDSFVPLNLADKRVKQTITSITIRNQIGRSPLVEVTMQIPETTVLNKKQIQSGKLLCKLYGKLSKSAKLKLNEFIVGQGISQVSSNLVKNKTNPKIWDGNLSFELFDKNSPLNGSMFQDLLENDGDFLFRMAINCGTNNNWSPEFKKSFSINENGDLNELDDKKN